MSENIVVVLCEAQNNVHDDLEIMAFIRVIEALDGKVFRDDGIQEAADNAIALIVSALASKGWDRAAALHLIAEGDITGRDSWDDHFELVIKMPGNGPAAAGCRMAKRPMANTVWSGDGTVWTNNSKKSEDTIAWAGNSTE